ncbi:hypothetical protein DEW08_00885 [Azospirillum thermophilum]|uniref:Uncharacterized protein n=1 Tax=Azospirillum thermophilum TaxID=2202148 RepID=A0A2S2CKA3_9PROT|nr:hypothetical protein DEW08_00885 [Azospirillum thermophilum]
MPISMFYERPAALNREQHATIKLKPNGMDFSFAAGVNSVPLAGVEFVEAARSYPIFFVEPQGATPFRSRCSAWHPTGTASWPRTGDGATATFRHSSAAIPSFSPTTAPSVSTRPIRASTRRTASLCSTPRARKAPSSARPSPSSSSSRRKCAARRSSPGNWPT